MSLVCVLQELSVEALQQVTGLPPSVVAHSLAPLTVEGGLLLLSDPSDLTQGEPPPQPTHTDPTER